MKPLLHAVIDAGSSGTRLFLYEVEPGPYPIVHPLAEIEHGSMPCGKREDGINNFVDPSSPERQQQVLKQIINPLLNSILPLIEEHGVSCGDVQVDLLATAGMRYAEKMFGSIAISNFYNTIKQGLITFGFKAGQVRTCDGFSEEGVWTWTNLNDLERDIFRSDSQPLGILEVGGSSAQITYTNQGPALVDFVTTEVTINGRTFYVYSNTYLGLGQDDARKEMRISLGNEANCCFPKGFESKHDLGDTLDGVGHFQLSNDGDYSYDKCNAIYEQIIGKLVASNNLPELSKIPIEFVATDAVYHATKFWDAHKNPQQLTKLILGYCDKLESFPGIESNEFVQVQAANATYIQALLYGKSGLFRSDRSTLSHALPSKDEGKTRLTWTRGYLMQAYARSS